MERIIIKRIKTSKNQFGQGYKYYLKCLNCSKVFSISAGLFNNNQGKFCSRHCSCEFRRWKGHIKTKCLSCGKEFEVNRCYLKRKGGKYCSLKCYHISRMGKPTWNKGLTKETDNRIKYISEKHKRKHYSPKTEFKKGDPKLCRKGSQNPMWNNGSSFEPYGYEFNNSLRKQIRKRDKYKCQLCGIKQKNYRRKLDIHHIDYIKKNSNPKNLITLCNLCNVKVNKNREFWTVFFKKKIII